MGGIALVTPGASAQEAAVKPNLPLQKAIGQVTPTGPIPSLFVLNARGATLADGKLTLTGASPNSIVFADRPVRAAGHIETAQFVETWRAGEDQFDIDPPNATVSVLGADGSVADAVVTISAPMLEGDNLVFDAVVLEGTLDGAAGAAALFIDRGGFGGFHGGGGMMAGGFHGGGDFGGGDFGGQTISTTTPTSRTRTPPVTARTLGNRTVDYDPHNTYYGGGGYYGGWSPLGRRRGRSRRGCRDRSPRPNRQRTIPIPTAAIRPIRPATETATNASRGKSWTNARRCSPPSPRCAFRSPRLRWRRRAAPPSRTSW